MNKKELLLPLKVVSRLLIFMAICTFAACSSSDDNNDKIVVDESKLNMYSDDLESNIGFTSNTNWVATVVPVSETRTSSVSWIELDKYNGEAGAQTLTITLELNETGESRSANIVISNTSASPVTISITQKSIKREDDEDADATTAFFISYMVDGTEYLIKTNNIEGSDLNVNDNFKELELSKYTWIFNKDRGTALGLIYSQGDPGLGLSYSITSDGNFTQNGNGFDIASRFTSYGFFENYALTSVCGQSAFNEDGSAVYYTEGKYEGELRADQAVFNVIDVANNCQMVQRTYSTYNMTGSGQMGTLSGVCDLGNGEFLTGVVMSDPRGADESGGSSTGVVNYPDSVWVASFSLDANLNPKLNYIVRDNRISYAAGRFRSQYYSMISMADDGYVYVFSPSYVEGGMVAKEIAPTVPAGALRIKKGSEKFDPSYYFNIESVNDGYHFKKMWFITGTYFLLELYNDKEPSRTAASTLYGVVNMANQTFNWVSGVPELNDVASTGLPTVYQGKIYLPITATGEYPAIYGIDPTTAKATKCISINGAESINAVGYLKYKE